MAERAGFEPAVGLLAPPGPKLTDTDDTVGRDLSPEFLVGYFVEVLAFPVFFTWFFVRSGGSVLITILLHATTNSVGLVRRDILPSSIPTLSTLWLTGVSVALAMAAAEKHAKAETKRRGLVVVRPRVDEQAEAV